MLTSLALIFLVGLSLAALCEKLHLPRLIGMLITGIVLGPHVLNALDPTMLAISQDLRQMALIIILIKAGLTLDLSDLKHVGRPAVLMAFVPAGFEILSFIVFAPHILHISTIDAAIMGAVLGAVSPAVVVPSMIHLTETGYGMDKRIPPMTMAAASVDDIFVIVLFTTFVGMAQGEQAKVMDFVNIPVSILCGIFVGSLVGYLLAKLFESFYRRGSHIRNSIKVIILLGVAFLLMALEAWLQGVVPMSGLLAIVSMACVVKLKSVDEVAERLSEKFGKLWLAAEIVLFVLVGAAVDIRYTLDAGGAAVAMIAVALLCRSVGVVLSLLGTALTRKERLFCVMAYLPKATVQAAIGSIPLALGLSCGQMVLSVAVVAILITAPLGALAIDLSHKRLLNHNSDDTSS